MKRKIIEIISEICKSKGINIQQPISESTDLREDLSFSSFDLAELTVKIEDEFDIDIFEDGLVNTVGEILDKLSE